MRRIARSCSQEYDFCERSFREAEPAGAQRKDTPMNSLRMKLLIGAGATMLGLASFCTGVAQPACPESGIFGGCGEGIGYFDASPTRTFEGSSWSAGSPCTSGCYDLPQGALHAEAVGTPFSDGCSLGVQAHDLYTLANAPAGPAVACQAVLQITGSLADAGWIRASLQDFANPAGEVDYLLTTATPNVVAQLVLPLSMVPGQPVHVQFTLSVLGDYPAGTAKANAVLRFAGLPPGISVVSCQSYDVPVPAQAATWGRVKSVYR